MPDADPMDVPAAVAGLNAAIDLQHRSALEATVVAATLRGVQWHPVGLLLRAHAAAELDDLRRLAEKVVALGGTPSCNPAPFTAGADPEQAVLTLVDHECEALSALHGVISASGQEPRSEALEHRLEHVILRKQEQVDALRRVLGVDPEAQRRRDRGPRCDSAADQRG